MSYAKRLLAATAAAILASTFSFAAVAACKECGTVVDVRTIKKEGEGTGLGAVLGGVAGGVIGHQIGHGTGRDVATVAGAAGGAYAGHQVEKKAKTTYTHEVVVKLEDGQTRTFHYSKAPSYRVGDRVKVVDHRLVRQ